MKIDVTVSPAELEEMGLDDPDELKEQLRNQLDNGVATDDGEAGVDWMVPYELNVTLSN